MSSGARHRVRAFIVLILLMVAAHGLPATAAADWEGLAASSGPSLDPTLLSLLLTGEMETRLAVCRGLAKRADPVLGTFIDALSSRHTGRTSWQDELCLRTLIDGAFDPGLPESTLSSRLATNSSVIDDLLGRIDDWQDPLLVGSLVKVAGRVRSQAAVHAIASAASRIVDELGAADGRLTPQSVSLARDCLAAIRGLGRDDMLWYCVEIARLSREKSLVDAARLTALLLAAAS
jgi:hypothetical protein